MIGIIGAMKVEVDAIKKHVKNLETKFISEHIFYTGKILDKEVVICLSGVGKVAASMATTILLSNFDVEEVINIGTAGGLLERQNTMDVVLSQNVIQHDFDTSYIDGIEGKGKLFESSNDLTERVKEAFSSIDMKFSLYIGDIVSGDIFVGEEEKFEKILEDFPTAIACDMESGAIGQVCSRLKTPFVIVRSLSDIVYHDNSNIDFMSNLQKTSERSAEMVVKYLEDRKLSL
ncbi:MAG: 5'-methylthioadenosine/adenosylhomocysteine nucleosidase [Tissierellia bacterium]|nr:5'-methylthioadenosine/adenosylhomocysteine nucleosidase [Tissierellia bacterium]